MNNILLSIIDEFKTMTSGCFIPYHKVSILLPIVVASIFSLIFSHGTIFEGKIAVIDLDVSSTSTDLIQKINTSPYIEVADVIRRPINPEILTAHDRNLGVLYIPKGFEKKLNRSNESIVLGYLSDSTNESQNAKVLESLNEYIPELGSKFSISRISPLNLGVQETNAVLNPMQLKSRNLFNPTSSSTNSVIISFIYFFSSLTYGLTTLMIIGRLKSTGVWNNEIFSLGAFALLARIIPYALLYTVGITFITALLVVFGQLRFEGNYFFYLPSIFMTALAFGWLAFILSWKTKQPGEGASRMVFLVPPGFILGGATMAVGILPIWVYYISYLFPLVWQYRFYRDFAMRGTTTLSMLSTYGAYLFYITIIAFVVIILYWKSEKIECHS